MGDPRLHPTNTFPRGLDVRDEKFREILNAVGGWAHALSNMNVVGMPHEISPDAIELGPATAGEGRGDRDRNAIITGKTAASGDRHTYTIKFAEKSASGYGNWQAKAGATGKTAFNREEEVDPATYIDKDPDGDGTNEVTIDGVPVGTPVVAKKVDDGSGGTEWWFSAAVQVTVSC